MPNYLPGQLCCFDRQYYQIYMVIYSGMRGCLIKVDHEFKTIKII